MLQSETFVVNPLGVNCHVVHDTDTLQAAIIDPGMFFDRERDRITQYVSDNNLSVCAVLLTHGHFDHAMSAAYAAATFRTPPPYLHAADWPLLQHIGGQIEMFLHRHLEAAPPAAFTPVAHGQAIAIGNVALTALHTPGHTPGGLSYHCAAARTVFTGDTLFCGSVGRTDLDGGDMQALVQGVRTHLLTLPPETRVLPGHGPSTTIAQELAHNPFL